MERALFIGAGELGSTLFTLATRAGTFELSAWDKDASKVPDQKPLEELVSQAQLILLCIPSWVSRETLTTILPHVPETAVVVSFAKGIESKEHLTMFELLSQLLPPRSLPAVVGGPMLAEEILEGLPTHGIVAGKEAATAPVISLFSGTNLHLFHHHDAQGVGLCGVLKNVYAVGLGIAAAMYYGSNANGYLISMAVKEMNELLPVLGGKGETALSPAGIGDLIATGFSHYSRNRTCGQQLVETGTCNMDSEGMISLPYLLARLGDISLPPFLGTMKAILMDKANTEEQFKELLGN